MYAVTLRLLNRTAQTHCQKNVEISRVTTGCERDTKVWWLDNISAALFWIMSAVPSVRAREPQSSAEPDSDCQTRLRATPARRPSRIKRVSVSRRGQTALETCSNGGRAWDEQDPAEERERNVTSPAGVPEHSCMRVFWHCIVNVNVVLKERWG